MQFHVVDTITNNVPLTEASIGEWVEWTSVLTDFRTGLHHRTVLCGGYYAGTRVIDGWLYAMFDRGHINGRYQNELGGPLARYTYKES